jgi:transcriptional regulator of acetoin/glycerol metabolism
LDELIELPLDVQAMLLRVIENREVLALGETRPTALDVRFIAASQIPLTRAVAEGRFRPDLRARLEGGVIALPSLGQCKEIVPELFSALYEAHSGRHPELSVAFAERLCLHDWPLNIRELDTLARRLALAAEGARLEVSSIDGLGSLPSGEPSAPIAPLVARKGVAAPGRKAQAYDESEMRALVSALAECGGNFTKAARLLGLSRPKAYRILQAATRAGLVD